MNFRPYARWCLKKLYKDFEIIVWSTEASKRDADTAMNYLDPEGLYIQYRLYKRSCVKYKDIDAQLDLQLKDIRILENQYRRVKDVCLIDSRGRDFIYHCNNTVPITNFTHNINDQELKLLVPYLMLLKYQDIAKTNRDTFHFSKLEHCDNK